MTNYNITNRTRTVLTIAAVAMAAVVPSIAVADVITPVSVVASSEFNGNAAASNLLGPGFTQNIPIETSTHENSNWNAPPNAGWFAGNGARTLDFDLGGSFTVDRAHVWNWNGTTDIANWSVDNLTITFSEDAIYGNADDSTQAIGLSNATGLNTYTGEHFALTPVENITNIRLTTDGAQTNNGILGLSEVRFSGTATAAGPVVPEPSTLCLSALSLLSLSFVGWRRRRR